MDTDLTAQILEDLDGDKERLLRNGNNAQTAFLGALTQACIDFGLNDVSYDWMGQYHEFIGAIYDFANAELSRLDANAEVIKGFNPEMIICDEATDLNEASLEAACIEIRKQADAEGIRLTTGPTDYYHHTEVGVFEGHEYHLTPSPYDPRYLVKIGGVESWITEEAVEDYPDSCIEHRLIAWKWRRDKMAKTTGYPPFPSPPAPPAPAAEPASPSTLEETKAPEEKRPETDDFLNPGRAFTKNIMRDWGQL